MVALNPPTVTPMSNLLHGRPAFPKTSATHFTIRSSGIRVRHPTHTTCCFAGSSNRISLSAATRLKMFGPRDGKNTGGDGGGSSDDSSDGSNCPFLSWYMSLLAKYPVITKAVTSAVLSLIGDLLCQIDEVPSLDMKRASIFMLLGLVLVGPALHFWYLYFNLGAYDALSRLQLDQFIFAPIFVGVFLSAVTTLEGKPSNVIPKLKQAWLPSVRVIWLFLVPAQFLNFRFVPQQFQILLAYYFVFEWSSLVLYTAHKEVLDE